VAEVLVGPVHVNLTAIVTVTHTPSRFQAEVRITSSAGSGARRLESASCETLADEVALVIALSASRVAGSGAAIEDTAVSSALVPVLAAHATAVTGPTPRTALGAGATLALEGISALRLELGVTYYKQQADAFSTQPQVGAVFNLLRVGARACRIWRAGLVDVAGCLGAQVYRIAAAGRGDGIVRYAGTALVWGPSLGLFGRLRLLPWFAVHLALDAIVPVSRDRFVFAVFGELHRPAAVALQGFLGPEVQF
jgi:hypothetical protein